VQAEGGGVEWIEDSESGQWQPFSGRTNRSQRQKADNTNKAVQLAVTGSALLMFLPLKCAGRSLLTYRGV
jgi:hypothetical protein